MVEHNQRLLELAPATVPEADALFVIIPTKSRPHLLTRALGSISRQTLRPQRVLVIADSEEELAIAKRSSDDLQLGPGLDWLLNNRTRNLSGAINTGLTHLASKLSNPENAYIAFLDDDDEWEPEYLNDCLETARKTHCGIVVSGIIRHEFPEDSGRPQKIPRELNVDSFMVENPHIQGSNLFVNLGSLLKAGGFDENLASTTDRDVCIRLFELGNIRSACLDKFLVHHWADDRKRLSSRGSAIKRSGLSAFHRKYAPRMTTEQRMAFQERAVRKFGCRVSDFRVNKGRTKLRTANPRPSAGPTASPIDLVVGLTVSNVESAKLLLDDLAVVFQGFKGQKGLVICDNSGEIDRLGEQLDKFRHSKVTINAISEAQLRSDANKGKFGTFFLDPENQIGISFGRTALHYYLYLHSALLAKPVVWILDDDVRIDKMRWGVSNASLEPNEFQDVLQSIKAQGHSVVIGKVVGDAPLPTGTILRTQLLDFLFNLRALTNTDHNADANESVLLNKTMTDILPDYYHDLSLRHHQHLETPFWFVAPETCGRQSLLETILQDFPEILKGRSIFRPVLYVSKDTEVSEGGIPMRGGNTIVFDIMCLREFPNIAPSLNGSPARRGDSLWSILSNRAYRKTAFGEHRAVHPVPFQVMQDRRFRTGGLRLDEVVSDVYGSAVVRSLDAVLGAADFQKEASSRDSLHFSKKQVRMAVKLFIDISRTRLQDLLMNAWRIQGLVQAIGQLREELARRNDEVGRLVKRYSVGIQDTLRKIEEEFVPAVVYRSLQGSDEKIRTQYVEFLYRLSEFCSSYRSGLPFVPSQLDLEKTKSLLQKNLGLGRLRYVGGGDQGLVFTDEKRAFKILHPATGDQIGDQLSFLKTKFSPKECWKHASTIHDIIAKEGRTVIVSDYVDGEEYSGGHLDQLLDLVIECRNHGIVLKNIHPSNIRLNSNGILKFVDLGTDVCPYRPDLFRNMCKRAYLTYRWHFRPDLKLLMTRSLRDESIPELFHFEHFLDGLEDRHANQFTDPILWSFLEDTSISSVLDYGCGKGRLAIRLAKSGKKVVGYDPDESQFEIAKESHSDVMFIGRNQLEAYLASNAKFDRVVCSLVVCTVQDDSEVKKIFAECHTLTAGNGSCIIVLCNPLNIAVAESETHRKQLPNTWDYESTFDYTKLAKKTNTNRRETHRPLRWYQTALERAGFEITGITEAQTTDVLRLCPGSDYLVLVVKPHPVDESNVTLLIKVSSMEWRTVSSQVTHIVRQLESPRRFFEKVIVTDRNEGSFARPYSKGDWRRLRAGLDGLVRDGIVDRVVVAPDDSSSIGSLGERWFGLSCRSLKCVNGQPTLTTLHGIDACQSDLIFQVDDDVLIHRENRAHDYLAEMIEVLESRDDALSVGFPVSRDSETESLTATRDGSEKWRTNVRCCLLSKRRLHSLRPLPNDITSDGTLELPWHRSVDRALETSGLQNYRGRGAEASHIHVQNDRKHDLNGWLNAMKSVECGTMLTAQRGKDEMVEDFADWSGRRNEGLVFLVRGRNVPASKLRACFDSLLRQDDQDFGVIVVDAASANEMNDYVHHIVRRMFAGRVTIFMNIELATSIENITFAITKLCSNPQTIIAELDADDALIASDVVSRLKKLYDNGVDATVGSMLRTDKFAKYPVNFEDPRKNRGGNVWQHLRSFRKYLFDLIDENDLKIGGTWIPHNADWAYMLPIIEMAKHPHHISDPVYFYEPTGKSRITADAKKRVIEAIVSKPSYKTGPSKDAVQPLGC